MTTVQDVLNVARSQIGVCENPMGSNSGTPYHEWYGSYCQGWQWCAIFVTWVLWHVDQALSWGLYTAYSGDYLNVGRMHLREIDLSQIAPGDICIWDRPVGGITDHIGFLESVTPTTFTTIEGNSGDCVRRNENRPRVQTSDCHYYFVRPNYSAVPKPQEDEMNITPLEVTRMPNQGDLRVYHITESLVSWKWAKELEEWLTMDNENKDKVIKPQVTIVGSNGKSALVPFPNLGGWKREAIKISDSAKAAGIDVGFTIIVKIPDDNVSIAATIFAR